MSWPEDENGKPRKRQKMAVVIRRSEGEKGTTKETELKKLNDFIKANKNFG